MISFCTQPETLCACVYLRGMDERGRKGYMMYHVEKEHRGQNTMDSISLWRGYLNIYMTKK